MRHRSHPAATPGLLAMTLIACSSTATAGEPYRLPPQVIVDMVDAPPTAETTIDPTGRRMLLIQPRSLPTLQDVAQPMLRLGGYRINPNTNSRFRTRFYESLTLLDLTDGSQLRVALPKHARLGWPAWSPDGSMITFVCRLPDGNMDVFVIDADGANLTNLSNHEASDSNPRWVPVRE